MASRYGMDRWLVIMMGALACVTILIFLGIYIYFALTDPDLLRSEKFSIQKMAIQHGFIGDDLTGYVKIAKIGDVPLIENIKSEQSAKGGK